MYYRGAAAAIVVYDITRASSFNTLKAWVRELQQLGPENIVIAVCGNKCDLEDKRVSAWVAAEGGGGSGSQGWSGGVWRGDRSLRATLGYASMVATLPALIAVMGNDCHVIFA